ncbi:hypothetical protein I3842_14G023600 [Carya illinoinensis]|uniref:Plasma membrane ATPase n=1 Tax=Carya illinoinensis TaxID=32201 RepID=A0A922D8Y8_CARIL|nr:hypothetical protein I3842_14G023600 [Carya illinoinensis]
MVEMSHSLDAVNQEAVDLENIPLKEVFEHLTCTREGLTSDEVQKRLVLFGYNKLEEKKKSKILKFFGFMWNPLSWVMEAAAVMAISLTQGGRKEADYHDFVGILVLLIINSTISFIEENNAGSLAMQLPLLWHVLREGKWSKEDASVLVPGDIISIKLGDIIPADARLLEGDPLKIDQSALTGESLPVTKNPADGVYSGSTCKQGEIEAVVIATSVLTSTGNFCICSIAVGMFTEIIVIYVIHHRGFRVGIDNLLVPLTGGIPIAMPTVLSVTMAIGSHLLPQQGAITKRMTAIEEMAGMDVLCSDKTGTLTLNKLTVDKNMIEVFDKGVEKDTVVLMAARASRLENQDAIDAAIVSMLGDPKEARAGIQEVHFLPFNPTDKRTALTYIDEAEQILNLAHNKSELERKVHAMIDKFAERGLRSLAVARQEVSAGTKDHPGGPWQFVGLLPLFDPPRHDSAETIRRALDLGVSVKMITGDQLAIAKETGRRLGMGTNMYPSSSLLGDGKDAEVAEHKCEIVKKLQARKHICGMTGDGVNNAPALKIADIGIAVADSTDAARSASDIVLTEPGLSVIISAVLTSRAIFQRMKKNTRLSLLLIYAVSITIRIVLGFLVLNIIWNFNFPPFMVLVIAVLNDGTITTISKDRVKPSPLPDSWKLSEIFATGIFLGSYLALMTIVFFGVAFKTDFFKEKFNVEDISAKEKMASAVYLQVSIISQALIFVTRSRGWSFMERPGFLVAYIFFFFRCSDLRRELRRHLLQTLCVSPTVISATANWRFAGIKSIGWGWTSIIWLYSIVTYFLLNPLKFAVRYAISGRAWDLVVDRRTAFTNKKDFGWEAREAAWAAEQRTLHGLQSVEAKKFFERSTFRDVSLMAEEAKRRAEIARMRELHTLKGKVESNAKPRGLDIDAMNQHYTL